MIPSTRQESSSQSNIPTYSSASTQSHNELTQSAASEPQLAASHPFRDYYQHSLQHTHLQATFEDMLPSLNPYQSSTNETIYTSSDRPSTQSHMQTHHIFTPPPPDCPSIFLYGPNPPALIRDSSLPLFSPSPIVSTSNPLSSPYNFSVPQGLPPCRHQRNIVQYQQTGDIIGNGRRHTSYVPWLEHSPQILYPCSSSSSSHSHLFLPAPPPPRLPSPLLSSQVVTPSFVQPRPSSLEPHPSIQQHSDQLTRSAPQLHVAVSQHQFPSLQPHPSLLQLPPQQPHPSSPQPHLSSQQLHSLQPHPSLLQPHPASLQLHPTLVQPHPASLRQQHLPRQPHPPQLQPPPFCPVHSVIPPPQSYPIPEEPIVDLPPVVPPTETGTNTPDPILVGDTVSSSDPSPIQHLMAPIATKPSPGGRSMTKVPIITMPPNLQSCLNPNKEQEDAKRMKVFAKRFKEQRKLYKYTQADVSQQVSIRYNYPLCEGRVALFESSSMKFEDMLVLKEYLELWILDTARTRGSTEQQVKDLARWLTSFNRPRRQRTIISIPERELLEEEFQLNPKPTSTEVRAIAERVKIKAPVARTWFCNRRQKLRTDREEEEEDGDDEADEFSPTSQCSSSDIISSQSQ